MARPTDGFEHAAQPDHPDLTGVAAEMRAEWRAEQEAAAADAAAQWRHGRSVADWLRDRMHAGDRIAVVVAGRSFAGLVEEVGDDLVVVRGSAGRVEIHVCAAVPISFAVVEHATEGGTRSNRRRGFRDVLLERDGRSDLVIGTVVAPAGVAGSLLVGLDHVTIVATTGSETIVPIAHVAWVTPARA